MRHQRLLLFISLIFAGLTLFLGYFVQRSDFQTFIAAYIAFFALYCWVVFYKQKHFSATQEQQLLWLGIGLRALLLFSIPNLSDDYARFLWDGHLTVAGIHPFLYTPEYFMEQQIFPPGITADLFGKLNSPAYYTVYPPVCQAVFALAAWLFPSSELGGVFVMKLFLLACEIGTIQLLRLKFDNFSKIVKLGDQKHLLYALNPLVILEICGNCHFEGAMIFFLLAGLSALQSGKLAKGAVFWALATASKMLPILFLPLVWRWLGWRKGLIFNLIFGVSCLILFGPVLAVLPHILESLDLYFRQFQFNASVYYLVREIGFHHTGWDIGETSGPVLGGLTLAGVLAIAWKTKRQADGKELPESLELSGSSSFSKSLAVSMLFALFLYLSLAATVQPWYITLLLALSLLTRWRFAIIWTGLAALSYSHYKGGGLQENYGLIALEYGLLWGFVLWEFCKIFVRKTPQKSS